MKIERLDDQGQSNEISNKETHIKVSIKNNILLLKTVSLVHVFGYCCWFTQSFEKPNRLDPGVLNTTLCDEVCQWLVAGRGFSPGTPVSTTNKTDRHDIAEILLKVALSTIKP